jgi:hypothetical protein
MPEMRRETLRGTRQRVIVLTLAILAACAPAGRAGAQQTFWVATGGSDAPTAGTSSSPWATISYAIQRVPDGSTILVRPGTYNGSVSLRGSFASGVVVRSEVPYPPSSRASTDRASRWRASTSRTADPVRARW